MPVPAFVTPPVPERAPLNVVAVLFPPVVMRPEPRRTLPAPASEPMVSLKLLKSSVAPLATVTAVALESVSFTPRRSVPALMVVAPV